MSTTTKQPSPGGCCNTRNIGPPVMCCGKPSAPFALQIAALSVVAVGFLFSAGAVGTCDFVTRKAMEYADARDIKGGIFSFNIDEDCRTYNDYYVDSPMEVAQAFGILASLFGGLVLVTMVVSLFVGFPRWAWLTLMIVLCCVAPSQLITLSMYGAYFCTDEISGVEDCTPDAGTYLTLIAFCLWITGAILICRLPSMDKAIVNCGGGSCCCCNGSQQCNKYPKNQQHRSAGGTAGVAVRRKKVTTEVVDLSGVRTITTEIVPI
mmetsp:Transcript_8728/g.12882  ORF Transcript_8728/g.12882 Transcript_8728/m.12882 type:complete len:264 (-) Transcript_8728:171-962(-)